MDHRKALFRAKLRETKEEQERLIDPSLVRYNEYDQPIRRVCNVTLKSEALWPAHQVSRKHHEAKAAAAAKVAAGSASRGNSVNHEQPAESQKAKSFTLPANLFDSQGMKRRSVGENATTLPPSLPQFKDTQCAGSEGRSVPCEVADVQRKTKEANTNKPSVRLNQMPQKRSQANNNVKGILPADFFDYTEDDEDEAPAAAPNEPNRTPGNIARSNHVQVKGVPDGFFYINKNGNSMQPSEPSPLSQVVKSSETSQGKGALPEGFFDNKDADLRARGIQPPKVDINDAYKEFEKEIQDNLQEVDDRLEEEEREYRQRVDMLKKQLTKSKATRNAKANSKPVGVDMESSSDSSSDEEDDTTDFAVDWRAQHLK